MSLRAKTWLLAALAAIHLAASLVTVVPGHFSVDEGTYHFMVRSFAEGHGFEIWNGYRERPSPELVAGTFDARDGLLVAVPPEMYTLLAQPFFLVAGYRGLFFLNALAFLGIVATTGWIGWKLTGERSVALDAALVVGLATFLWDYSQAAWPHATATLFVVGAFAAMLAALSGGGTAPALLAGFLAGAGVGVRLDAAFALPAFLLPFLFERPPRWRQALAVVVGALPPLGFLAWVNQLKFGLATPFTYGRTGGGANTGLAPYLPVLLPALAALAVLWIATRRGLAPTLRSHPRLVLAAVLVAIGVSGTVPAIRDLAGRLGSGLAQLLVDLRFRPLDLPEPALGRTPSGALVYLGALKKSLLQSCPFLPAVLVPAAAALSGRGRLRPVVLLSLVPAGFILPYSLFAWHGGMSLNLRYFVPVLPFAAVLTAMAWREVRGGLTGRWLAAAVALAALVVVGFARAALPLPTPIEVAEPLLLDIPLSLALVVGLLSAWTGVRGAAATSGLRAATATAVLCALTWAGAVTFLHDAPRARLHRSANLTIGQRAATVVEPDSILFAGYPDPYFHLLEIPRLRLAVASRDGYADFRALAEHHLTRGRPVYASFPPRTWRSLADAGMLDGLAARPLLPSGLVVRLEADGAPGSAGRRLPGGSGSSEPAGQR